MGYKMDIKKKKKIHSNKPPKVIISCFEIYVIHSTSKFMWQYNFKKYPVNFISMYFYQKKGIGNKEIHWTSLEVMTSGFKQQHTNTSALISIE